MSVQAENFTIQQGETFSKDFILKNPDSSLVGISSYTSTAFMSKYAGDTVDTSPTGPQDPPNPYGVCYNI